MELAKADLRILAALQQDGRVRNVELGRRVSLSPSSCLRRMQRLERDGVIDGYSALLSKRALGLTVTAFVLVTLERQPEAAAAEFAERVRAEPHIVECHATSGTHDYLLKVVARDMDHFAALVMQGILKYPGVRHVESSFSLGETKEVRGLPLPI